MNKTMELENVEQTSMEPNTAETKAADTKEAKSKRTERVPRPNQWILALFTFLLGYLYVFRGTLGVNTLTVWLDWNGGLVLFTLVFAAAGLFCARKTGRYEKSAAVYLVFTLAAALWLVIYGRNGDQDISPYVVLFLHCMGVYWVMALSGNRLDGCLNERGLTDLIRGFVILPFSYFGQWFGALWNFLACLLGRGRTNKTKAGQAALGFLLSIPLICVVLPLLMGADAAFSAAVSGMLERLSQGMAFGWTMVDTVWWGMALFVCCYLFGLFFGAFEGERKAAPERKSLPAAMLSAFLAVFVLLYAAFFFVKLAGVPQALADIGNGDLLSSTYAREGFFELCWIAAINFGVYSFVKWYWPQGSGEWRRKVWLTVLGVQTLAFIGLAMFRMGVYIGGYGLTFKRVFTTWFMVVLMAAFLLLILENWRKVEAIRVSVLFGCVTFLLLAYSNIPAWTVW